jgi:hypothetical protein
MGQESINPVSLEPYLPGIGPVYPSNDVKQRSFPGAIGPNQARNRATANVQRAAVNCHDPAETLRDILDCQQYLTQRVLLHACLFPSLRSHPENRDARAQGRRRIVIFFGQVSTAMLSAPELKSAGKISILHYGTRRSGLLYTMRWHAIVKG